MDPRGCFTSSTGSWSQRYYCSCTSAIDLFQGFLTSRIAILKAQWLTLNIAHRYHGRMRDFAQVLYISMFISHLTLMVQFQIWNGHGNVHTKAFEPYWDFFERTIFLSHVTMLLPSSHRLKKRIRWSLKALSFLPRCEYCEKLFY